MIKVINLKKEKGDKKEISFIQAINTIISTFPERGQKMLVFRYGLDGSNEKTLEEIGKFFEITRERVRQIIQELLKKIKNNRFHPVVDEAISRIIFAIRDKNGIIKETELISFFSKKENKSEEAAIKLIIDSFKDKDFVRYENNSEIQKSISVANFDLAEWKKTKNFVKDFFNKELKTLGDDHLFEKIGEFFSDHQREKIFNWLSVSQEIKKNSFGKWGLSAWPEITPRNIREKAYLVFKETGHPLHFRKVAELIDKFGLNKRKTHRQTVHNELIKDDRFVLIGRGIYALAEWGYKQGTVKQILEDILKNKTEPMRKEDVVKEVLKMKQVKKSTILINLNAFFKKNEKNQYSLKTR